MSINRIYVRKCVRAFRGDEPRRAEQRHPVGRLRRPAASLVEAVIDHMLRHLDKPPRVSTWSAMTGVSSSHFFALFRSVTGQAPKAMFIRLRMEQACRLLMTRTVRVKEVAAALGYSDPYYFSRLFKSVTGIAPRDYRRKRIRLEPSLRDGEGARDQALVETGLMDSPGLTSQAPA